MAHRNLFASKNLDVPDTFCYLFAGVEGWLRIQLGGLDQTITLVPKPRHFGGCQWYCGCHEEPTVFAVVRRGEGASPTPLNFWTQIIVLIEDEPKSKLD